jgi:hypothetical protein
MNETNQRCYNCLNCTNCTHCLNCANCTNCDHCRDCRGCHSCVHRESLTNVHCRRSRTPPPVSNDEINNYLARNRGRPPAGAVYSEAGPSHTRPVQTKSQIIKELKSTDRRQYGFLPKSNDYYEMKAALILAERGVPVKQSGTRARRRVSPHETGDVFGNRPGDMGNVHTPSPLPTYDEARLLPGYRSPPPIYRSPSPRRNRTRTRARRGKSFPPPRWR